ncbi:MAG: archaeosortase/exosortase family protein [Rhodospirillaceae bacterium]
MKTTNLPVVDQRTQRIPRGLLVFGLLVVAILNGLAAERGGMLAVDPVTLAAALAGLWLIASAGAGEISRRDCAVSALAALIILIPHDAAGWAGAGVLGAYGMIAWRRFPPLAAGAAVFFVLSLHEVWAGRLLMNALAPLLTESDAALATGALSLLGQDVTRQGNVIITQNGYELVVVPLCTTFRAFWYGLLCCFAFTRLVRPAWHRSELATWALLAAALLVLNTVRLTLFGLDLSYYDALHGEAGGTLFNLAVLMLTLAIATNGVRREFRFRHPRD